MFVELCHTNVFNTTIHGFQIRTDIRYTSSRSEADSRFVALWLPKLLRLRAELENLPAASDHVPLRVKRILQAVERSMLTPKRC